MVTLLKRNSKMSRWSLFGFTLVLTIILNFPIITMVLNSFRSTSEILSSTSIIPTKPSLVNYIYVFERTQFVTYFFNSVIVAGGATLLAIVAAVLSGYSVSRFHSRGLTFYSNLLLIVQMFPVILALIPLFILFRTMGLINTPLSVIIIYTVAQLPFATAMFRAFFDGIPKDLEEAAQIDGASRLRAFAQVVLPLVGPAIAAVSIFTFLFSYNEYLIANIFLRNEDRYTIPVGIQTFTQQFGSDWGGMMASATLAMLPTFILFLFIQKYMVYGAVGSGVKG